ncbi:sugar kinase [bacterium]|nr:sugar kinase [bacterium]
MTQYPNSILAVGSMAFDSIQTPAGKVDQVLGGSANFFSIAASIYAPVDIVGVVGEDFPKDHLLWLSQRKIDVSGVQVAPGKTFHWVGSYGQDLSDAKTLSTALNVFEHFDPRLSHKHSCAPYVFLANIDPELQQKVLDQVQEPRLVACDSMNFWIAGKLQELRKTLARFFIAPAYPTAHVVDPTGAGDSFAGAFMGYLAEAGAHRNLAQKDPVRWEQLLRRAVLAGCVMASFTVEDFSFRRLTQLKISDLVERQETLMRMIRVD